MVNFDEIDRSFLTKMTTLLFYLIHSRVSLLTPVQKGKKEWNQAMDKGSHVREMTNVYNEPDVVWLHSTGALGESASRGNLN